MKRTLITTTALSLVAVSANAASIWLVDIDGRNDNSDPGLGWHHWAMYDLSASRGDNTEPPKSVGFPLTL